MPRYVIVANRTLGGPEYTSGIDALLEAGPASLFLVVPVTDVQGSLLDRESSRTRAQARLHRELARLRERGIDASGEVITGDVVGHVRELAREHHVNAVLVSTLPPRVSRWLRIDLASRLSKGMPVPVRQVQGDAGPPLD